MTSLHHISSGIGKKFHLVEIDGNTQVQGNYIRCIHLPATLPAEKLQRRRLKDIDEGRAFGKKRKKKKVDTHAALERLPPIIGNGVLDVTVSNLQ